MRKFNESEKTIKYQEVVSVTCDRCGKDIMPEYLKPYNIEGGKAEFNFGWGSRYDMEDWSYELCDDCCGRIKEFIESDGRKTA